MIVTFFTVHFSGIDRIVFNVRTLPNRHICTVPKNIIDEKKIRFKANYSGIECNWKYGIGMTMSDGVAFGFQFMCHFVVYSLT